MPYFPFISFFLINFLECSCFAILCLFMLYSKVNQSYVYIYTFPFGLFPHSGHHSAFSRVPLLYINYLFYTYYGGCKGLDRTEQLNNKIDRHTIYSVYVSIPISQFLAVHAFVLYVYVSISALQI